MKQGFSTKKLLLILVFGGSILALGALTFLGPAEAANKTPGCSCHDNGSSLLSKLQADPAFSVSLHRAHENSVTKIDCLACHSWPDLDQAGYTALQETCYSWANSTNLDSLHANNGVSCSSCHDNTLPAPGDRIANEQCFQCHGSYADIASKTVNPDDPELNPHQSHLGPISCGSCHKAHSPSKAYCLNCHPLFEMPIPGGEQEE